MRTLLCAVALLLAALSAAEYVYLLQEPVQAECFPEASQPGTLVLFGGYAEAEEFETYAWFSGVASAASAAASLDAREFSSLYIIIYPP